MQQFIEMSFTIQAIDTVKKRIGSSVVKFCCGRPWLAKVKLNSVHVHDYSDCISATYSSTLMG